MVGLLLIGWLVGVVVDVGVLVVGELIVLVSFLISSVCVLMSVVSVGRCLSCCVLVMNSVVLLLVMMCLICVFFNCGLIGMKIVLSVLVVSIVIMVLMCFGV